MRTRLIAGALTPLVLATPAMAEPPRRCAGGICQVQLTPQQLLAAAERLVQQRRYAEAAPLLVALRKAPGFLMQSRFLTGYIAAETGDYGEAARQYQDILADDPKQTSVRLALAKVMLAMNKPDAADRQFRMAEQDRDLPPEVLRTIRTARDTLRASKGWQLDVNIGIAPDTNINNATAADTVTVMFGNTPIPLTLNDAAKARSGLGVTGQVSSRLRLPLAPRLSALTDLDITGTDYGGSDYDDYVAQVAAGLEFRPDDRNSGWIEGVAARRWFGGSSVSRQIGVKGGAQTALDQHRRLGVQIDLRRTKAYFDDNYSGWQGGLYGTYEQSLSRTTLVSIGPFVRRDWLKGEAVSNVEVGANVGVGGEMPLGINFGISGGVSEARYDAAIPFFSPDPRHDTRYLGRATLGNRKVRVLGLSPQVSWSWSRIDSSIKLYETTRSRFEFTLARYF